ncbi:class I adenylate-forming enzyme family protein [Candidimonas nitroreducens]|uniref:Acid--CoA ligase n=1 Tax=Candidimonas nitroreducens TaxID=683354 RepID=A0A225M6D7_9BURK|nr:class I adenylate-forming enzyme family protein [Candidimonas nitroreducens]OWT56838.1 acid--CoA ligase [Candidimonas nitroreducens]
MSESTQTLIPAFFRAWQEPARTSAIALLGDDRQLSYAGLFDEVGCFSGQLHAMGIQRAERVAIAMERSVDLVVALLAVLAAGACPCVLEPRLGSEETKRRFAMTGMRRVIVDAVHADDLLLNGLPGIEILRRESLPKAEPYWALDLEADAPGFLLFTSGSSGKPKGVLQSHRGLLANAQGVVTHTGLSPSDRLLHVMPLYHTNGVNNQILAPLLAGCSVALAGRFKTELMPGLFTQYRPTITTGVPTMYARMLAVDFSEDSLSSLRMLRCGSAPITPELHQRVERKFGKPLILSYGLSEATCTSSINPPAHRKLGSVGTVLAGQQVFLIDGRGEPVNELDRDGEICIAGSTLMLGYLDEGSEGAPRPMDRVLHSGDLGRFDCDGYLYITGRIKEVIIRGGENLSPTLIESVLCKVPGVHAACVVGRPDAEFGEVPWAFIVRADDRNGAPVRDAELGAAVETELSRIHKPAGYSYVDRLPENSVGKVDRKALAVCFADA